jgi:hypothetical protein
VAVPASTKVSLRIIGDDLVPEEITDLLHGAPMQGYRKGDVIFNPNGTSRVARHGRWSIQAPERHDGDLDAQIVGLLVGLTDDMQKWNKVTSRYRSDLFCGVFMGSDNDGLVFLPQTMQMIGARGLKLGLDIYS